MGRLVQENLKLIIDAVGEGDAEKALTVWRSDAAIDEIYDALFRELITYMNGGSRNITPCTHLLFIAKNLERVGDPTPQRRRAGLLHRQGRALTDQRRRATVRRPGDPPADAS